MKKAALGEAIESGELQLDVETMLETTDELMQRKRELSNLGMLGEVSSTTALAKDAAAGGANRARGGGEEGAGARGGGGGARACASSRPLARAWPARAHARTARMSAGKVLGAMPHEGTKI